MCRLKVLISLIIIDIDPAEYLYGQAPFGPGFFLGFTESASNMIQPMWSFWQQDSVLRRQWQAAFIAGLITLLPLILAIDLYIDDIERAMNGGRGWVKLGRPLADVLVEWLNFGRPATAIAPLHTILAIALLSSVGVACARAYGISSPFWTAIATLPLMAQPYALQAMSYGFDSLFISVALASSVMAAFLIHLRKSWKIVIIALVLQLVSFGLYQPAANGFLAMTGCFCVASGLNLLDQHWQILSQRWRLFISVVIYAGGYGFYRLILFVFFEYKLNKYAAGASELKLFDKSLISSIFISAFEPIQILIKDFNYLPILLPFLLLFSAYVILVAKWRSLGLAISAVAGTFAVLLVAPGGMLLLSESFARHPRVLLYLGPLLMSLVLQISAISMKLKVYSLKFVGVFPLIWLMVVMSYAYGHAYASQAHFEQARISRIVGAASILRGRNSGQNLKYLVVNGVMPRSPVLQNTIRKFPLIDRLIPPLIEGDQTFSYKQLELHGLSMKKRSLDDLVGGLPVSCNPSSNAICTSEFSLHAFSGDTLYLELAPDAGPMRPRT